MSEMSLMNSGLAAYLAEQIGREVIAEFRCGSDDPVRKAGTLTAVQQEYIVIRDDMNLRDTVCSLEHLCFVTFYLAGTLPRNEGESSSTGMNGGAAPTASQSQQRTAMGALSHTMRKGRKND